MSVRKPVIGIVPAYDKGAKVPGMREGYLLRRMYTEVLAAVGALPVVLNYDMSVEEVTRLCDGVVISGGEDINPRLYGGKHLLYPEEPRERTDWEVRLLVALEEAKKPVLGICYGMQLLAVANGGSLHQDISLEVPDAIRHADTAHERNRSIKHKIVFTESFLGFEKESRPWVASRHHQAVSRIPDGFTPVAYASDGVLEAMRGPYCYGIQWHPESDETGIHVYRAFVEICRKTFLPL